MSTQDAGVSVPPTVSSATHRTSYARLDWEPGQGPVVKPPFCRSFGFLTQALAKATDGGPVYVTARGVVRKKDGTPGLQKWRASYRAEDAIPAQHLDQLLARLEEERRG